MFIIDGGFIKRDSDFLWCAASNKRLTVNDLKEPVPSDLSVSDLSRWIRNNLYVDCHGLVYCKEESENFITCANCGRTIHKREATETANGNLICRECYANYYATCAHCGRVLRQRHGDTWIVCQNGSRERLFLCNDCTDHADFTSSTNGHYHSCDRCGDLILEGEEHDINGMIMCERCYHDLNGDVIHSYHYRSDPGYGMPFLGIESRKSSPLMGVELEIDRGGENNSSATQIRKAIGKDFVVACHDGSLRDGFELISCPASYEHHIGKLKWRDGMIKARELGYISHDGGRCGLHVHIVRKFFETDNQNEIEAKFFVSFRNNLDWLKVFSRRFYYDYCMINGYEINTDGSMDTLGKIPYPPDRVWVQNKKQTDGRHMALNFEPQNTIEVRIFRGTLNYETFVATLQFVKMWAGFIKRTSYEDIVRLRLTNFVSEAERRGYREFVEYLKVRNIIEGENTGY